MTFAGRGLIVPDVHEQIDRLKQILEKHGPHVDWVVFLGDFFDSWDGLTEATHRTARWLAENVHNPKYRFLMGNHDAHYFHPIDGLICGGYTGTKQSVINCYMKPHHWKQFRLFEWVGDEGSEWLCSHAGIHQRQLHPILGFEKEALREMERRALARLDGKILDPLFAIGKVRGGWYDVGGVMWLHWHDEFQPVAGLHQIVGHTFGEEPRWKIGDDSMNVNLDTGLNHVLRIDGDEVVLHSE